LKQRAPGWRRRVDRLALEVQVAAGAFQLAEKADKTLQRAAETVHRPGRDDINLALP